MRFLLLLALVGLPAVASADGHRHHRYIGIHPIAKSHGGGLCHIEGPHVHIFEADKVQYRDHHGAAYFVGDPVAYGWDGPKHVYKGHHPIQVHAVLGTPRPDVEFCYLDGAHYHYFTPPEGPDFKVVGDAYFYVGKPPKVYVDARPQYIGINAVYTPLLYTRPVVEVEAPVGWIGAVVVTPAVVVAPPAAVVVTPGVKIRAGINVNIGIGGGVIVHDRVKVKHKHRGKHKHRRRR